MTSVDELTWEAPGPGFWEWQGSHIPGVPTPIYGAVHLHTLPTSIGRMFERYGVPLHTMDEAMVNGRLFASLQPLVGKAGAAPPPKPLLWLATRLHPEFRRRTRRAAAALDGRVWRARTEEWRATLRPALREKNLAFQAEDIARLDDAGLADHVDRVHTHVVEGHLLHFDLHGDDMGPLGLFLAGCRDWGIAPGDGIAALTGHSPSTMAAVEALRKVAVAVAATGPHATAPTTIDGLRALGPSVAAALDEYLDEYGWRVVTGYDIDAKTVGEMPEILVSNVLSLPADGSSGTAATGAAAGAALRERVPEAERGRFDEALAEARVALDLRDDNGPMTAEWPVGLLRRSLLEVGRRAAARGALVDAEHAVELTLDEARAMLRGGPGPGAAVVAQRAAARAAASKVIPPATLGAEAPPPDLSAFPRPLARVTDMAMTAVRLLEREAHAPGSVDAPHRGLGVGTEAYAGPACVAHDPEEALANLAPGDVLVVPFTTPAYNAVLSIAGGLITEEGGALSHAAVLARELDLPAVIGVSDALTNIGHGDEVEVDPTTGTVRLSPSRT